MLHLTTVKNESVKNKNDLLFNELEIGSFFYYKGMSTRRPGVLVKISPLSAFCLSRNKKVAPRLERSVILIDDIDIKSV